MQTDIRTSTARSRAYGRTRSRGRPSSRPTALRGQARVPRTLVANQMGLAHKFDEIGVGHQALLDGKPERFGQGLGVVDGHPDLERADVETVEALGHLRLVASRRAVLIDPSLVLEPPGLHHQ